MANTPEHINHPEDFSLLLDKTVYESRYGLIFLGSGGGVDVPLQEGLNPGPVSCGGSFLF